MLSLCLHGILALVLCRLPCRGYAASPSAICLTYMNLPTEPAAEPASGKLIPGDSRPASSAPALAPFPKIEIALPSVSATGSRPGPQIGEAPASDMLPAGSPGQGGHAPSGQAPASGTTTTFFGIAARGQKVVYVLDRSSSMGLERLATARRELLASLRRLPPTAQFQIIIYNSHADPLLGQAPALVPATPANIAEAVTCLETVQATGGTRHVPALTAGLYLQPDELYFLTDADDLEPSELRDITRFNTHHVVIHTIELTLAHQGQPAMPMQTLARTTGGTYRAVGVSEQE
jgi:hypothetical protein